MSKCFKSMRIYGEMKCLNRHWLIFPVYANYVNILVVTESWCVWQNRLTKLKTQIFYNNYIVHNLLWNLWELIYENYNYEPIQTELDREHYLFYKFLIYIKQKRALNKRTKLPTISNPLKSKDYSCACNFCLPASISIHKTKT